MDFIKKFLDKQLTSLNYYYKYLGYRMWIMIISSFMVGLLDGLGLTMFIPLLEIIASNGDNADSGSLGNFGFIVRALETIGLELDLMVVLLTMLTFFLFKGLATFFERYLRVVYQQYFIKKLRFENIKALVNYDYEVFTGSDAGKIQNTLSGEVERVIQSFRGYSDMLQKFILLLTYMSLAIFSSPVFSLLVFLGGVLSNFLFSSMYKKTKVLSRELVAFNSAFQGNIIQLVAFYKYLKATSTNFIYQNFLNKKVTEIEDTTKKMGVLNSIIMGIREPLMISIIVIVILIQVKIIGGSLSTVILTLLFFYRGLTALTSIQSQYNNYLTYSGSIENMKGFTEELISRPEKYGNELFDNIKSIKFDNVNFSFDKKNDVLKNIDLNIKPKESIAFIGESGSGKTTMINLISGLLKPDSGKLLINDTPIENLNLTSYRKKIGYITQEAIVFDDTLYNNITLWQPKNEENLKKYYDVIKSAQLQDFVDSLEYKEDENLGNNGVKLSGGQKQRISIARELYKNIDILIMDEATSALDTETEKNIQSSIDALKGKYTIVMIAHRLSTIKNADKVVIFKKGEIELSGTYENVLNNSESFKRMIHLQEI